MSLGLYDLAIVKKLRFWAQDDRIAISDPDTLFTYRADADGEDKIKLPLISLNRGGNIKIKTIGKTPLSREGIKFVANDKKVTTLRGIPISIPYQLDIYARKRSECDDLFREFVFKLVNNPRLEIEIPYEDSSYTHKFTLTLDPDVEDNSDVAQHLEKGEFFRMTINIVVEDAYLFDYRAKDTMSVEVSVDDENK